MLLKIIVTIPASWCSFYCIGGIRLRRVPHGGFAAVQDDILHGGLGRVLDGAAVASGDFGVAVLA